MTRLSDSLRGLADRAPMDEVVVSTSAATRRIHRGRRLRAAANATAGVGVAAVIALAAINPGANMSASSTADAAAPRPEFGAGEKAQAPGMDASAIAPDVFGECGSRPFDAGVPASSDGFSLTLGEIAGDVEPGSAINAPVTIPGTPGADPASQYSTFATSFLVMWDGMVVGTGQAAIDGTGAVAFADSAQSWESPLDLVNCWDGTALPGGEYELVAYQDFYPVSDAPATEPAAPPASPEPQPTLAPSGVDPAMPSATPDDSSSSDVVAPDAAVRAYSNSVTFVVAGDVPEDPFGAYLTPATPEVVYPDDYLTPADAREEFAARIKQGQWDMAKGTQRVVKTSDSTEVADQNTWLNSYYGCSADGTTSPSFPSTSADWPLLGVDAKVPGSVGVSYGFVVDGNPEVNVSVTNISGHTLPGFWGQPNAVLYLVKDGKVVANSYLTSTDPYGTSVTYSTDGLLEPDGSVSGTYLWRDVSGCWLGNEPLTVTPGTYTVLMVQDLYLDNGSGIYYGGPMTYDKRTLDVPGGTSADGASAGTLGVAEPEVTSVDAPDSMPGIIAPAPADGTYDSVSLQVWTSLGRVTVN